MEKLQTTNVGLPNGGGVTSHLGKDALLQGSCAILRLALKCSVCVDGDAGGAKVVTEQSDEFIAFALNCTHGDALAPHAVVLALSLFFALQSATKIANKHKHF